MWRWVKEGYVKSFATLGGHHRILKADLDAVLADNGVYRIPGATQEAEPPLTESPVSQSPKILIVDDDPQVLKMLPRFFKGSGYDIAGAADGFEAGVKVMSFAPDLVVLDLMMPGIDGFEVCKRIKENPGTAHIKVLAVSGYGDEENEQRILAVGADVFLPKPIDNEILLKAVSNLLRIEEHSVKGKTINA